MPSSPHATHATPDRATRYIAVCKYEINASPGERRRALSDGLREIGYHLIELGLDDRDLEQAYTDAADEILDEWSRAQAGAK